MATTSDPQVAGKARLIDQPGLLLAAGSNPGSVVIAGPDARIASAITRWDLGLPVPVPTASDAVQMAMQEDLLLAKGKVDTASLGRAMIDQSPGVSRLAHVSWIYVGALKRAFLLADAGINLQPAGEIRLAITRNALAVARALGMDGAIALVGHGEGPDARVDASRRSDDWARTIASDPILGGRPVIGPISLDLALSPSSRVRKNSRSLPLVHVLLAPDIVVANVMFKAFQLAGGCHAAGIVVSDEMVAAVPSRSGSTIEKALSVALARLVKNSRFKPHASGAGLHG